MKKLGLLLKMLISDEVLFSQGLNILIPTFRNPDLKAAIVEAKIVEPIIKFIEVHMPE